MDQPKIINIPTIEDPRGGLAVLEKKTLPFQFKRVYYLFDVPSGTTRGGHAHKKEYKILIAVSGSFDVTIKKNYKTTIFKLNKPNEGLILPPGNWRELSNFSSGSTCLVLASDTYNEDDYIRNYNEYLNFINQN